MNKQIFNEPSEHVETTNDFQPKREFEAAQASPDPEVLNDGMREGEQLAEKFEQIVKPRSSWWKKALGAVAILFLAATLAQSIQWLLDTWAAGQWIYFAFALVGLVVVLLGLSALVNEWRRLRKLKKRLLLRDQSLHLWHASAVGSEQNLANRDYEQGKQLCLDIVNAMELEPHRPELNLWLEQINETHSAQEVAYLFSQNVLQPIDKKAKRLISQNAAEAALIVAVSPLALLDMFFIAWRNIRLINRIARIYGIELGYLSRLRLLRMVLLNVAFAGASELVHDIGMDWLSQDLTAKLSARAAQGIGVGLLTARLGIKAIEFCRPLAFQKHEKPRLSGIHKELLTTLKASVLTPDKLKQPATKVVK